MSITITLRADSQLDVETPFNQSFIGGVKALGGRWNPNRKVWNVSASREAEVRALMVKFFGTDGADSSGMAASTKPVASIASDMPRKRSARDFSSEYAYLNYQAERVISFWKKLTANQRSAYVNRYGEVLVEFRVEVAEGGTLDRVDVELFPKLAKVGSRLFMRGTDIPASDLLDAHFLVEHMEGLVEAALAD